MATQITTPRIYANQRLGSVPVKSAAVILIGEAVGKDAATGFYRTLVAGDEFAGFSCQNIDATSASSGALTCQVANGGDVQLTLSGLAQTSVGLPVYATGGDTFSTTPGTGSPVGIISAYLSSTSAMVRMNSTVQGFRNVILTPRALTPLTGAVTLDFDGGGKRTMAALTGNITISSANLAPGLDVAVFITGGASGYTITLPATWRLLAGLTSPITLAASKKAVLSMASLGTTDAEVICSYTVES